MSNGKLTEKKHNALDFVNVSSKQDYELFLDPTKLHSHHLHPIFKDGIRKLHSFLLEVYRVYVEEGENQVRKLLRYSSECNLIHLGYSSKGSKGTGASEEMLFGFFKKIIELGTKEREILLHPASIAIFVPKFAEDRTSDLLVSILKKEIVEYTLEQATIHNFDVEKTEYNFGCYWDLESLSWKKIKNFYVASEQGKPILLVPKCLVSQKYKFSTADFVKKIIFPIKRELGQYQNINGFYKNGDPKPATQIQLIDGEIRSPYKNCPNKWKTYAMDQLMNNHNWYNEYFHNMNKFADNHIIPDEVLDAITNS
ncbi:TPA: hypothetical protein ACGO5G_001826 [Streptococcus suis]